MGDEYNDPGTMNIDELPQLCHVLRPVRRLGFHFVKDVCLWLQPPLDLIYPLVPEPGRDDDETSTVRKWTKACTLGIAKATRNLDFWLIHCRA